MQKSIKTSAKIEKNMLPSKNNAVAIKQDKLFFAEIAAILHKARATAYKAVNTVMIQTNWQIGKRIVE